MHSFPLKPRLIVVLFVVALIIPLGAKDFVPPRPQDASTYPAHDVHPMEHAGIGVEPYDRVEKAKVFDSDYLEKGLLPVYFVVTNSGDRAIALVNMKVSLVTKNRTKIQPATEEDILRKFAKIKRGGVTPMPIPIPRKPKAGVSKELTEELETAPFRAVGVDPKSTVGGFFFFDVSGVSDPLEGANIYVTGVRDGDGNDLMYFEIPLDPSVR